MLDVTVSAIGHLDRENQHTGNIDQGRESAIVPQGGDQQMAEHTEEPLCLEVQG
jgi:hypothetical protein